MLAFWGSNLIVYWSGWQTDWKLMVAVLIGFVLLGVFTATGVLRGQSLDLKAGLWVLPWLGSLTLVSWLGDYDGGLGVLGFGTAIPVLFVVSLAIYVMAYRMRLPDDQARAYIEATTREAAVEEHQLQST